MTVKRSRRCPVGIDNGTGAEIITYDPGHPYDRCRRRAGHVDGSTLGQWHLPDCGGAFTDLGAWESDWIPILDAVIESGEKTDDWGAPLRAPLTGDPIIDVLRRRREHLGLTQAALAQAMGRQSGRTIHNWESGSARGPLNDLREWAGELGFDVVLRPKEDES